MPIINRHGWALPESAVTPAGFSLGRRRLLEGALGGAVGGGLLSGAASADVPAQNALRFDPGRPVTPEKTVFTYNNYYEFGSQKSIWRAAQRLRLSPWSLTIDGLVKKPLTIALPDLIRRMPIEQRIYRHRCVEAWAMTVPWQGFALSALVKLAEPLGSAKFLAFTTVEQKDTMPGLVESWYPWPYREGVTMAEATNELAFLATGLYGMPLKPQNGGPIRLVLPWKYGFKSAKSLIRISFVEKQPPTFWSFIAPNEYGFWANVNPAVPHPRWSQAYERLIGTNQRVPTRIYNGYGKWVAPLYAGMPKSIWLYR